jgi:hypothetical protein
MCWEERGPTDHEEGHTLSVHASLLRRLARVRSE